MRILLLNQTFHPDVASTAQYASDLAATLAARGHEVTVVCSRRAYDSPETAYQPFERWRGVEIRRISNFGFGKTARWRRALDFGSYIISCVAQLAPMRRFDVVIGMTSPPLISWVGAWYARIRGGKFVFWVMDLNPDEAIAAGWLREGAMVTRALQHILSESLKHSALVIVLDRYMADRIQAKGVDPAAVAILPPWSHDDALEYDEAGRNRFRREHGLTDKFVVMYSGNHSPCHPLTTLLEAAERLRHRPDIRFCFVGGGSEVKTIRRFTADRALPNIVVLPYQPLSRLAASLSSADLHAVVMGDPYVGIVHPCKVYNIRALGIPFLYIGPADSHVAQLSPIYSARHGDVNAVVHHIREAAASGASRPSHESGERFASRDVLLGRMVGLIESMNTAVLGSSPSPSQSARV